MAFFDDVKKKTAQFAETAIDKTGEMAGLAKLKLRMTNLKSEQEDVYNQLGHYYFNLTENDESLPEEVKTMKQKISDFQKDIDDVQKEMDAVKSESDQK